MSASRPSDPTREFYSQNARAYAEATLGLDMGPLHESFLALVPAGSRILDAGCGSGRDAREFKRRGYRVTAVDASPELARLASEIIGQPVRVLRFEEMTYDEDFDGIWACASLLHVPRTGMDDVLARLSRALRWGGVVYASFKVGEAEQVRGGRLFNDYSEESLGELFRRHPELEVVRTWRTQDQRPSAGGQCWLNLLARKSRAGPGTSL
jgi:SAM-dependent methyltransferase